MGAWSVAELVSLHVDRVEVGGLRMKHASIILMLLCFAVGGFAEVDNSEYSIIEVTTLFSIKRSVDVRLEHRVSEGVLREIAQALYVPGYDRTFMGYYLPYMEVGEGGWATTHFNPDINIEILGMTPDQLEYLLNLPSDVSPREWIGEWFWEWPAGLSHRITIYRRERSLYMETLFLDGGGSNVPLKEKFSFRGRRFEEYNPSWGEYYLLDSNGDLHIGDEDGLFDTLQRIAPRETDSES